MHIVYSTYLGGTNLSQGDGIAVDALGRAWVTGVTESNTFPVTGNAIQPWPGGGQDAFVSVIASNGLSLVLSTYLGGVGDDAGYRIVLDANKTTAFVVGTESSSWTYDGSFPITPGNINPGGVFTSTNAGQNWSWTSAGLLHSQVFSLAVNPVTPSQIYAGTGHGVARSSDGGAFWEATVSTSFAPPTVEGLAPPIATGHIFALALNPNNPSTIYAGTSQGVYQSLNAGTNWTLASTGLASGSVVPYVQAIAVNAAPPLTLYAGTSVGVFSSTNLAANWVAAGLSDYDVRALAIDTNAPGTVYAATTSGVYRSTNSGAVATGRPSTTA